MPAMAGFVSSVDCSAGQLTLVPTRYLFKCVWLLVRFNTPKRTTTSTYVVLTYNDVHIRHNLSSITCKDVPGSPSPFFQAGQMSYVKLLCRSRESLEMRLHKSISMDTLLLVSTKYGHDLDGCTIHTSTH